MSQQIQTTAPDPWMDHMFKGDFQTAWKFSDEVLRSRAGKPCWHWPRHLQYVWDGSPLEGKTVLIRCYHGLGDTIQFIRYAPMVKTVARKLIVWAQPALIPLLQTVEGIDEILPLHDGTPEADYDVDVEVMELPHIFRTTLETIPQKIPYLHVDEKRFFESHDNFAIGLVWKAGNWALHRNIPFEYLEPLFEVTSNNIFIMQEHAEAAGWTGEFGIHPGEVALDEYAKRIRGLDLLISIDSMPVHLAGALGVPVWTLLHADADWRWMRHRDDSPWYPGMRLFRQKEAGNWQAVIEEVIRELELFKAKTGKKFSGELLVSSRRAS